MPLMASSLSKVCRAIADFMGTGLNEDETVAIITLGNPGDAVPSESEGHRLNLFFFRFEPFNFDADILPGETWRMRMHCLITPFAVMEDAVSAGENDLRLVGEVLRLFHERPVFKLEVQSENFHVQVIPQNLGLDQINQLWSTQGDLAYRPSLLYEVSLAPIIPKVKAVASPMVGSVGMDVRADMKATGGRPAARAPDTQVMIVNAAKEDWAPVLAFVLGDTCAQSLSFALDDPALPDTLQVWVAGQPGAPVSLQWEIWNSSTGWAAAAPAVATTATSLVLNPEIAAAATTVTVALPLAAAGQAVLYASRTYTRASDGAILTTRSNPLLVNLFEAAP